MISYLIKCEADVGMDDIRSMYHRITKSCLYLNCNNKSCYHVAYCFLSFNTSFDINCTIHTIVQYEMTLPINLIQFGC